MTTTFLWAVLHKLWDFSPILAPTIVIYLIDAPVSLKVRSRERNDTSSFTVVTQVWIAAQNAPRLPENPELPKGTLAKPRQISPPWTANVEWAIIILFLLVALGMDYVVGDLTAKKWLLYGLLVLPGTYAVSRVSSPQSNSRFRFIGSQLPWRPTNLLVARTSNKEAGELFIV